MERPLTADEIEQVLSGIKPRNISPDVATAIEHGLKEELRAVLREEQLTPEDMEQLKNALDAYYDNARVVPGEPVGVLAALSMGEPSTQMELSSHRHAGMASKNTNSGIPRLQELLRVTEQQKAISMSVYFNVRYTLEQLREQIPRFVARNLAYFVNRHEVLRRERYSEEPWHRRYRIVYGYDEPTPEYVLRLRLDVPQLRRHGLTVADVAGLLAREAEDSNQKLTFVFSPTHLGIIEVHTQVTVESRVGYLTENNALFFHLRDIVWPKMADVSIGGVKGITDAFAQMTELTSFITAWVGSSMSYDMDKARKTGVAPEDMVELLTAAGYPARLSDAPNRIDTGRPGTIPALTDAITAEPRLLELNTRWYLETNGSNLARVLAMDDVDANITFSTDIIEINKVFGTQAVRDYLVEEFVRILSSDVYVDPRHLVLLADLMVNLGVATAVTSAGVARQKIGPLTRSAFERPVEHFLRAAASGETEVIRGVAASIYAGTRANIGPNAFLAPAEVEPVTPPADLPPTTLSLDELPEEDALPPGAALVAQVPVVHAPRPTVVPTVTRRPPSARTPLSRLPPAGRTPLGPRTGAGAASSSTTSRLPPPPPTRRGPLGLQPSTTGPSARPAVSLQPSFDDETLGGGATPAPAPAPAPTPTPSSILPASRSALPSRPGLPPRTTGAQTTLPTRTMLPLRTLPSRGNPLRITPAGGDGSASSSSGGSGGGGAASQ